MTIDYKSYIPLKTSPALVWKIEFSKGKRQLIVTSTDLTVESVINLIKVINPNKKFTVSQITVGLFNLDTNTPIEHSYTSDARKVDQNMSVNI